MLATGTRGTVGVDPQLLVLDLDLDLVVDLRVDVDGGKGCVPAAGGVEWADPHQPVHTAFSLEIAVGVLPADRKGGALDSRLFTLEAIQQLRRKSVLLGPAQVHAEQHLRPILRLRATGSRVNRH